MLFGAQTVYAQAFSNVQQKAPGAIPVISKIVDVIVTPLVQGLFVLTVLVFVWGLLGFFMHAEDSSERTRGQSHMIWGVVGMFIMASAYGIIRLIAATVGVGDPFQ